jgi:uncharacterized membrane protein YgcG
MRLLLRALALAAALAAGAVSASAEEILSFDVTIEVLADGAIDVTETIRVTVEGDQIKRGIIRDFPVEYREADGRVSLASFEALGIRRNGQAEPYSQSRKGAYASLRIGQASVFLPVPSEQVYEIRYRTQGQLRPHGTYDELYWNVTGNEWDFPIRAASVEIRLPAGTPILQHAGYTGPRGATGRAYEVTAAADGIYRAHTTAPLGRREGFTVAVGWAPGAVTIPPVRYGVAGLGGYREPMMLAGHRLGPFAAVAATLIGALALLAGWLRVGRDPPGGAIYPQFDPPEGLSPAAARYVKRFGFDPRCLTAAIISMAVKGALEIVEQPSASLFRDREYVLEPLGWRNRGLSVGERGAYRKLFPGGSSVTLTADKTNGARVDGARAELKSKLWDEHYGASFRRNTLYTVAGVALGVAAAIALIGVTERWYVASLLQWGLAALAAGLLSHFAAFLWFEISDLRRGVSLEWRRLIKLAPFAIFIGVTVFQFSAVVSVADIAGLIDPGILPAGAAFGVVAMLFHFLMAAPTKAGRALMDHLEGFELYMRTAEEDRLNLLNPPEHTPELFERLLPYAVALGVAHQWSAKFADVLAMAAAPSWYVGSRHLDIDALDREFSHAVSSTTVPSRGSSGSGGGGSSGGGGGGGGGGGW